MITEYKINNQSHYITFCKKNNLNLISKSIEKIKSDRNILLVYDANIKNSIIDSIYDELKVSGCNLIKFKCSGDKTNKNEKLLFKIINILIENKFTKKSILLVCGGGVVGDVAALASSLYLRGLFFFNIPTTMTAIVDSSIGGKTAINYKGIINSLGTYYHPKNVFIMEDVIDNLPKREFISGIAEVIKCGLIDKNRILKFLKKNKDQIYKKNFQKIAYLCNLTLETKIKFFLNDINENNQRLFLNFGHTFAHAIEMALENHFKKDAIRHGEAVALGILSEIFYANRGKNKIYKKAEKIFNDHNLPTKLGNFNQEEVAKLQKNIYQFIFLDKKKINQYPRFISLKKIGKPNIAEIKDFDFLNDAILNLFE